MVISISVTLGIGVVYLNAATQCYLIFTTGVQLAYCYRVRTLI